MNSEEALGWLGDGNSFTLNNSADDGADSVGNGRVFGNLQFKAKDSRYLWVITGGGGAY